MHLIDMVTTYLYWDLDTKIYMKVSKEVKLIDSNSSRPWNTFSIRLRRSIYGLKQSRRMWYNHLSAYVIGQGYENNKLCPACLLRNRISDLRSLQYMSMT